MGKDHNKPKRKLIITDNRVNQVIENENDQIANTQVETEWKSNESNHSLNVNCNHNQNSISEQTFTSKLFSSSSYHPVNRIDVISRYFFPIAWVIWVGLYLIYLYKF